MEKKRLLQALAAACIMILTATAASASTDGKGKKYSYPDSLKEIVGIVVEEHEADWYRRQHEGWLKQARLTPKDEKAWLNCYRAKNYEIMYTPGYENADSAKVAIVKEMERHIPDTYVYNTCAYMSLMMGQKENYEYGKRAVELMPKKKSFFDYDTWICFMQLFGDKERYPAFVKAYYKSGIYSKDLLQFSLNELACMDEGGIFVGNGDVTIIPKWLIQDGMGKHRDKLILCYSFLYNEEYCKRLFKELGIGEVPPMPEMQFYDDYERYIQNVIEQVAVRTGRKLYMSKYNSATCYLKWTERKTLYDIGMLHVNSPGTKVDVCQEQRRLFDRCDFRYLDKPIGEKAWISDSRMSAYMARNFGQLLLYCRDKGDTQCYEAIHSMMEKAVKRISDPQWKEYAEEDLENWNNTGYDAENNSFYFKEGYTGDDNDVYEDETDIDDDN